MRFSIRVTGATRTIARFGARAERAGNLRVVHRQCAVIIYQWILRNFDSAGALVGGWRGLAASTLRRRRRGRGAGTPQILRDTGAARNRWDLESDNRHALVRSRVDYTRDHNEGRPAKRLPQRRILPSERQVRDLVRPIFRGHVRVSIR